jgi:hypothetical protein
MGGASLVDMLDTNDLSLRRARLDIPFYAEEEAGSRNGALAESLGFLPDLTQIVECLQVGLRNALVCPSGDHAILSVSAMLKTNWDPSSMKSSKVLLSRR